MRSAPNAFRPPRSLIATPNKPQPSPRPESTITERTHLLRQETIVRMMKEYESVAQNTMFSDGGNADDDDEDGLTREGNGGGQHRSELRHRSPPHCLRVFAIGLILSAAIVGIIYKVRDTLVVSVPSSCLGSTSSSSGSASPHHTKTITYDPAWRDRLNDGGDEINPFDTAISSEPLFTAPSFPDDAPTGQKSSSSLLLSSAASLGYIIQPHVNNSTLVFVAEGDLYYAQFPYETAVRLTYTVGNVRTPKLYDNNHHTIAFTATYEDRREVYVMNLLDRVNGGAQRITYWDSKRGVSSVVGWKDANTVIISAERDRTGLPDIRLYEVSLTDHSYTAVPLSQAIDGVWDETTNCYYFVRYKQSSWTVRYVGGTAENIWKWCTGDDLATRLFPDYKGTMKAPSIVELNHNQRYLFFLSDRNTKNEPSNMNVWAMDLSTTAPSSSALIQLTQTSCQFGGMAVQEYTVDSQRGTMLLRIGADLYSMNIHALAKGGGGGESLTTTVPSLLPIRILSDFNELHERLIAMNLLMHMTDTDAFATSYDTVAQLLTLRGQLWVVPVLAEEHANEAYLGGGQNTPLRRYRVVPGARTGGIMRVLSSKHVPLYGGDVDDTKRLALVLATDPLSETAEHAFYLLQVQADHPNEFADIKNLPKPFVGGHVNGGSAKDGGLGSVNNGSVIVSSCGRRFAWTDTDGRICVMTVPLYNETFGYHCLPSVNHLGEPLSGTVSDVQWSPGGRYLAVQHRALNQFRIITLVDCGAPMNTEGKTLDIVFAGMVQATPSRFNSFGMYWGKSTFDIYLSKSAEKSAKGKVTTLYFLSDRDIKSEVDSPWGTRAPMPNFNQLEVSIYALPLPFVDTNHTIQAVKRYYGRFSGAMEVSGNADVDGGENAVASSSMPHDGDDTRRLSHAIALRNVQKALRGRGLNDAEQNSMARFLVDVAAANATLPDTNSSFPEDPALDFSVTESAFMRKAYRLARIPRGDYFKITSQADDDGSLLLSAFCGDGTKDASVCLKMFSASAFPSDQYSEKTIDKTLLSYLSTSRKHLIFISSAGVAVVKSNTAAEMLAMTSSTSAWTEDKSYVDSMALSVWPRLEYRQMYGDAWRMLRDYFYDANLHGVDWIEMFHRYKPLVARCAKREDLDDILGQMAGQLSALHVFVYGGEYDAPKSPPLLPASLGVTLERAPEWKGYRIVDLPESDPDFDSTDGVAKYSPLSEQTLRLSGQRGLAQGDVIVAVNGESVIQVPDINMLLRGTAGQSVRLDVLRLSSLSQSDKRSAEQESIIAVPITTDAASLLRYDSWERKSAELAETLAKNAGFSVGYVHMRAMGTNDEGAFARAFFPAFDRDGLIIDVRHNLGGNIDSWILTMLQRKAWMFWAGRTDNRFGDMDWTEQFAFRGKVVVLVDELTSSNGEGLARGISELGIGKMIGTRTWGGGIWGSSANNLVDNGIAAAPQWGIFNDKFGWGGGIESTGVEPDIVVDNNPRTAFDGKDDQMERAIHELKKLLADDPIPPFKPPPKRPDMSLRNEECFAQ